LQIKYKKYFVNEEREAQRGRNQRGGEKEHEK